MYNLLKFRYFFVLFLFVNCKDAQKQEPQNNAGGENTQATNILNAQDKVILFFGDSLTAGYGIELEEAFPALIQNRLDSLNLGYTVINSGLSGETTSGGLNRIDWVLSQNVDVFVLELGANDGLRGIPLDQTKTNLQGIIDLVRKKNGATKIVLAGMQIPPNMGPEYTSEFRKIFPELARENEIPLIPFLLDGVAGIPKLNLEDGIHPTPAGHKIVTENVWAVLKTEVD
ncbi:MAG: arylesterase [Bacteroidota bacterium]